MSINTIWQYQCPCQSQGELTAISLDFYLSVHIIRVSNETS